MRLLKNFLTVLIISGFVVLRLRGEPAAETPVFTQQAMESAFTRSILSHFNLEGDLQVGLERAWVPDRAVTGPWTLTILEYPNTAASTMLVRCQVTDSQGPQESAVLVHAALWRDAWAVKLPIEAGSAFDTTRLETRRSDMLREHELLPATIGDAGYVFARAVPVGRVLTWHDVSRHQQVRKGDLVEVTASEGMLKISMKVLALESGVTGDTITVRNPDSKKDFSALVTDENHVEVQF
ncbi:MAG TPA: flagellar basal body P-ring formation chaperone FlgA [Opitutaceae bacterium]